MHGKSRCMIKVEKQRIEVEIWNELLTQTKDSMGFHIYFLILFWITSTLVKSTLGVGGLFFLISYA